MFDFFIGRLDKRGEVCQLEVGRKRWVEGEKIDTFSRNQNNKDPKHDEPRTLQKGVGENWKSSYSD